MNDISPQHAFFIQQLNRYHSLRNKDIRNEVMNSPFTLSEDEAEEYIKKLEANFDITQSKGSTIIHDHEPWLPQRKLEVDFFYWNRLKNYFLSANKLPPYVINTIDNITDEILDYCGDPENKVPWKRRGMVLGHVQSGKTTNYASLICKAADAGYKIIILLAGVTNSLRKQTQERLDETFIGYKSIYQAATREPMPILNYGGRRDRSPAYGTSRNADFSKQAARTYGISLNILNEPIIFVTKKNKNTLETLQEWLREQNPGDQIQEPLLLIDDEADNASINTSKNSDQVTAINNAIRGILSLFTYSSYVGYTATPFANIFINPESYNEMIGDDLFPNHFIKALDPPSNYLGAHRVFGDNADLHQSMIREIKDHEDVLPIKHKKGSFLTDIPGTLYQAIRIFILTRAISVLRGNGQRHSSMMINVSRFNDMQTKVEGLVFQYLEKLRNSIRVNSGLGERAQNDPHIADLKTDFETELSDFLELYAWHDVQRILHTAITPISVKTVNKNGGELDYSNNTENGLHVIAIGGLALSRGLTLEGLTVSYVLRNASASDTLMQMARWFGYRQDYEDLCKLYLPPQSIEHYEFITNAIEELRTEIKQMESLNKTPADFGLRVRHSPAAIQITAPNKMHSAETVTFSQDYHGNHIEGYTLQNNESVNQNNRKYIEDFLSILDEPDEEENNKMLWKNIHGKYVLDLLKSFQFGLDHPHLSSINGETSLFQDYVQDRLSSELKNWDVAIPFRSKSSDQNEEYVIHDRSIKIRVRESGVIRNNNNFHVTKKSRLANKNDELLGLSKEEADLRKEEARKSQIKESAYINLKRDRPLLLIHYFEAEIDKQASDNQKLYICSPIVSLSFCMPRTKIPATQHQYKVNQVYKENLKAQFEPEPDDDEE